MEAGAASPTSESSANSLDGCQGVRSDVWQESSKLLYSYVASHVLNWPSLTVQWVPPRGDPAGLGPPLDAPDGCFWAQLLLGTHTSAGTMNSLAFADILLPLKCPRPAERDFCALADCAGFRVGTVEKLSDADVLDRLRMRQVWEHPGGEPNKARANPETSGLVASISLGGAVTLFDRRCNQGEAAAKEPSSYSFVGHTQQGWGLSWAYPREDSKQLLATAADDAQVFVWDVGVAGQSTAPVRQFQRHEAGAMDVAWFPNHEELLVSCGDDGRVVQWDMRVHEANGAVATGVPDGQALNAVAVNPGYTWLIAAAGAGREIWLMDQRKLGGPTLGSISGFKETVTRLEPYPKDPRYLLACGTTQAVHLYDISACGKEEKPEDAEDGPPELVMLHAGHAGIVSDIGWLDDDRLPLLTASVSDDNGLQIWAPAPELFEDEDEDGEGGGEKIELGGGLAEAMQ